MNDLPTYPHSVDVVEPSPANPDPILVLVRDEQRMLLSGPQAVYLAIDLLEHAGQIRQSLDESQQKRMAQGFDVLLKFLMSR